MVSWCGATDCTSVVAVNSNRNNLLWRNVPAITPVEVTPIATDYTFRSRLLLNGYDNNANRSYWLLMITSWFQIVLWGFSLMTNIYKYEAETHSNYDEFSIHDPEESSGQAPTLDSNGCDKNGYDIDGNDC